MEDNFRLVLIQHLPQMLQIEDVSLAGVHSHRDIGQRKKAGLRGRRQCIANKFST